jgi:hypothetical protein
MRTIDGVGRPVEQLAHPGGKQPVRVAVARRYYEYETL